MMKKFAITCSLLLGNRLFAGSLTQAVGEPTQNLVSDIAQEIQEQYPFPVIANHDLSKILLKSRLGRLFSLSIFDVRTQTRTKLQESSQTQLALTWNPKGTAIAWLEPVKTGCGFQLRVLDLATKKVREFLGTTASQAATPLRFSPDGHRIAMIVGGNLMVIDLSPTQSTPQTWVSGVHGGSDFLWLDDQRLIVSPNDQSGAVVVASNEQTKRRQLFEPRTEIKHLSWSQAKKTLLASVRGPEDEFYSVYALSDAAIEMGAKLSSANALVRQVVPGALMNAIRPRWLGESQYFVFLTQLGDQMSFKMGDISSKLASKEITSTVGELEITGVSSNSAVITESSQSGKPQVYRFDRGSETLTSIKVSDLRLKSSKLGVEPVQLSIESNDHVKIYAQLWPASRALGSKHQAIVWVHGGPHLRESIKWNPEIQSLTARGIDFMQVNYRGSTGYGQKFENLGDDTSRVADIDAAISYLVNERKISAANIFLMGSSYGGYLAAKTVRDKNPALGGLFLLSPGASPETPNLLAATESAQTLKTKSILIFQGEQDCVILPNQGLQILKKILGGDALTLKSTSLKVYPDEGHHFHRTSSRADMWAKVLEILKNE